jgi:raffinose/stachyose/melibiose transport system substrate-binding protein
MAYRAKGKFFPFIDHQWKAPQIQQALIAGVQGMFAGTETPKSIAEKMDEALLKN